VPTIVFDPVFAKETVNPPLIPGPYTMLNSPTVYLILWGSAWNDAQGNPVADVANLRSDVLNVLQSGYIHGLNEYGNPGVPVLATTWVDPTDPPSGFNAGGGSVSAVQGEIQRAISTSGGIIQPPPGGGNILQSPIYLVITAPNVAGSNGGYNTEGLAFDGILLHPINMVSVGTSAFSSGAVQRDFFDSTVSHELEEVISDPGRLGVEITYPTDPTFPGFYNETLLNVNNNPSLPGNQQYLNNSSQLGDGEQEPGGEPHYGYRLRGVKIQSLWSANTPDASGSRGAFIVADGNSQSIYLDPIWTNTTIPGTSPAITGPVFTGTYNLVIRGDQIPSSPDDDITVSASDSGVTVYLDSQLFFFDTFLDGGLIRNITIQAGIGTNTIDIQSLAADQSVRITAAGTDTVVIGDATHQVSSVAGTTTIQGNGHTILNINDSDNVGQSYAINGFQLVRTAYPTPVSRVNYSGLASLAITEGGSASISYLVNSTAGTNALTITAASAVDVVTVGVGFANPGFVTGLTVQGDGETNLRVDNSGEVRTPIGSSLYESVATQYTVGQRYLARTEDLAQVAGLSTDPSKQRLGSTINYSGLSLLTITGGFRGVNTYQVNTTAGMTALQITAQSASDNVTIGDAADNAGFVAYLDVEGNGNTTLRVDDRGNVFAPLRSSIYQAAFTQYTVEGTFLTRTELLTQAAGPSSDPFVQTLSSTIFYHPLKSVVLAGGPFGAYTYQVNGTDTNSVGIQAGPTATAVTIGDPMVGLGFVPNPVSVVGNGATTLTINDQASAGTTFYTVTSNMISSKTPDGRQARPFGAISYSSIQNLTLNEANGPSNTTNIQSTPSGMPLMLNTGSGNDTTIFTIPGIGGPVRFDPGAGGNTTYLYDGPAAANGRTYVITSTGFQTTDGFSLSYVSTSIQSFGLFPSNPFGETINLQSVSPTQDWYIGGYANDTFNVGSTANTTDSIQGRVTVAGGGGTNTLNINDQGATTGQGFNLYRDHVDRFTDATQSGGPVQITTYSGIQHVTLSTGSSQDAIGVASTQAGTVYDIYGGGNFDQFAVSYNSSMDGVQGVVHLHDPTPLPVVTLSDARNTSGHIYTLQAGSLQRQNLLGQPDMAAVTWDSASEVVLYTGPLYLGLGNDQVNVPSVTPGAFTAVAVETGDKVTIGNQWSLTGIQGTLRIQAAAGQAPQVTVDDSADKASPTANFVDKQDGNGYGVYGLATSPILFALGPSASVLVKGGTGNDRFKLTNNPGAPSLTLDGGAGTNTLDYSLYVGDVRVNLGLGTATGAAGGLSNFQNVTGSQGNDLLVGNANANVLIGGTGRNVIIGGAGPDTLDVSLATSDNIVIGGTTDYDTNAAALDAIFAEWARADLSFRDRFSDLTTGTNGQGKTPLNQVNGQLVLLTSSTVHADSSPDTLIGSNLIDPATGTRVHNWFFDDADDTLVNFLKSSDHETKVK
jgi:hypothetical protein